MFDNRKIKLIEKMQDGDAYLIIWLKLLALAGDLADDGLIYITPELPYNDFMLADVLNRTPEEVGAALTVFTDFGMLELIDGVLHICNWEKYQNVEAMDRAKELNKQRQAAWRERKKAETVTNNVTDNVTVTLRNATEEEEDKEEDKDKEKELFVSSYEDTRMRADTQRIVDAWNTTGLAQVQIITAGTNRYKMLRSRISDYGADKIIQAIDKIKDSDFLKGQNNKGWVATFDWFIKPNNFIKVLEGSYDRPAKQQDGSIKEAPSYNIAAIEREAINNDLVYKRKSS